MLLQPAVEAAAVEHVRTQAGMLGAAAAEDDVVEPWAATKATREKRGTRMCMVVECGKIFVGNRVDKEHSWETGS
jgi:hypothetical protein